LFPTVIILSSARYNWIQLNISHSFKANIFMVFIIISDCLLNKIAYTKLWSKMGKYINGTFYHKVLGDKINEDDLGGLNHAWQSWEMSKRFSSEITKLIRRRTWEK
jgi:hypothetical protein